MICCLVVPLPTDRLLFCFKTNSSTQACMTLGFLTLICRRFKEIKSKLIAAENQMDFINSFPSHMTFLMDFLQLYLIVLEKVKYLIKNRFLITIQWILFISIQIFVVFSSPLLAYRLDNFNQFSCSWGPICSRVPKHDFIYSDINYACDSLV